MWNYTCFLDYPEDTWQELKNGEYYLESLRPTKPVHRYQRQQDVYFGFSRIIEVKHLEDVSNRYIFKMPRASGSVKTNKNEARILKLLNEKEKIEGKEYLIQLLAFFKINKDPVMVFPFYRLDLGKFIEASAGRISIRAIWDPIKQMLKIMDFLSRNDLIHRDIKPENFLMEENGQIKLCDFGLAFFKNDEELPAELEGSVHYMSPELLNWDGKDSPPYDIFSDMWGLGCTIYKLLKGDSLFPSSLLDVEVGWRQDNLLTINVEDPFKEIMEEVALSKCPEDTSNLIEILKGMLRFTPEVRPLPSEILEFIQGSESPQVIHVRALIDKAKK